jgi:hypothetical protein
VPEIELSNAYRAQVVSIYATHRRHSGTAALAIVGGLDENPDEGSDDFRKLFSDQVPYVVNSRVARPRDLRFEAADGSYEEVAEILSARLEIYALPFPADQVVAALIVDIDSPDMNTDSSLTARLLRLCANARVRIEDTDLAAYIDGLAAEPRSEAVISELPAGAAELPLERHQLVLIGDLRGVEPPHEDVVKQLIYRINPPYRAEFTKLRQPDGLNQAASTFGAVSPAISFLYGHSDDVENSVFLTTIQAVGTASRFQQIWQEAYRQVRKFQVEKQAKVTGQQERKDLETLADEMGNLELDLAFSVETAADLGLRIPSSQIDSFHEDLYEVMQIRTRANTVSQMFIRLGGSIRSELTAIESRETQKEEARRLRGAAAFGALSFVIAPISFVIGFFGINASQIHPGTSMWNWHYYHWAYAAAIVLALVPLLVFALLYGADMLRRWRVLAFGPRERT